MVTDTIPFDLVVDTVVIMVPQAEVVVVLLMIHVKLAQIAHLWNLKVDIDVMNILNMAISEYDNCEQFANRSTTLPIADTKCHDMCIASYPTISGISC